MTSHLVRFSRLSTTLVKECCYDVKLERDAYDHLLGFEACVDNHNKGMLDYYSMGILKNHDFRFCTC